MPSGVGAVGTAAPPTPTDRVLVLCAQVLAEAGVAAAELTAIAVGAGPGSFTGLRIGLATGKGLAYALGKPLWLASSLAALAYDLAAVTPDDSALLVPALDARRGELYVGCFRRAADARLAAVADERVLAPAALADVIAGLGGRAHLAGDALATYGEALAALPTTVVRHASPRTPSALSLIHI